LIDTHFRLLNGQGTDREYTLTVNKRVRLIAVLSSLLVVLTSCSSTSKPLSTLTGILSYKVSGNPDILCAWSTGNSGTLESGAREILGTIEITGVQSTEPGLIDTSNNLYVTRSTCNVTLSASEINLGVDVLVIDFNIPNVKGHWILKKSEFSDGEISLMLD